MSCDGGHLGFPIGIKNSNLVKDIPMIICYRFSFQSDINMAAKANNMLWLAEISKIFFSEINELTESKLYIEKR
jgi:hypothetical protein